MKRIISYVLDKLCAMTGHWRGCWILNRSPLDRLWYWSMMRPPKKPSNGYSVPTYTIDTRPERKG